MATVTTGLRVGLTVLVLLLVALGIGLTAWLTTLTTRLEETHATADELLDRIDQLIERQWQRDDTPATVPSGQAIDQWLHYGRHHSKSEGVL